MEGLFILSQQGVGQLFFWSLLLICLVIVAFVIVLLVRRRTAANSDYSAQNFTLSDLRRMRGAGEIDEEQFKKLRDAIIGSAKSTGK